MNKKILYILFIFSFASLKAHCQESKYQALYISNFVKYIEWPYEVVTVGVVGNSQVLLELQELAKKNGHFRVNKISGNEGVSSCHMIFLPEAQTRNFALIQRAIGNLPIVLVAENDKLIHEGAEMAFYLESSKLKFYIKKGEVDKTGLVINNRLLSLAKVLD